jgi:hypothetical protein
MEHLVENYISKNRLAIKKHPNAKLRNKNKQTTTRMVASPRNSSDFALFINAVA